MSFNMKFADRCRVMAEAARTPNPDKWVNALSMYSVIRLAAEKGHYFVDIRVPLSQVAVYCYTLENDGFVATPNSEQPNLIRVSW